MGHRRAREKARVQGLVKAVLGGIKNPSKSPFTKGDFQSITAGSIPRSSLGCDSDVGWVESFGVAQDRLRETHHPPTVGIGAPRLHPPYNHAQILFAPIRYPAVHIAVPRYCQVDEKYFRSPV